MKGLTIVKIRLGSLAGFYAAGFGIVGFVASVMAAMTSSINYGQATESLLKGLVFGVSVGVLQTIFVTAIYAAMGAVVGFLNALVFNIIASVSNGVYIEVKEDK